MKSERNILFIDAIPEGMKFCTNIMLNSFVFSIRCFPCAFTGAFNFLLIPHGHSALHLQLFFRVKTLGSAELARIGLEFDPNGLKLAKLFNQGFSDFLNLKRSNTILVTKDIDDVNTSSKVHSCWILTVIVRVLGFSVVFAPS
jgi:hypothetical protein